jgi:hypothetical protein
MRELDLELDLEPTGVKNLFSLATHVHKPLLALS